MFGTERDKKLHLYDNKFWEACFHRVPTPRKNNFSAIVFNFIKLYRLLLRLSLRPHQSDPRMECKFCFQRHMHTFSKVFKVRIY